MEHGYLIIILLLLGMMAATVPVFMSLFFSGVLGILLFSNYPIMLVVQSFFRSMDKFALVVVLFFT